MKRSKGMQLSALLAAILLLSMAFVPAVSAVSATPTKDPDKKLSELSKDEQKLFLKAIDSNNFLTDTEKKNLTKNLNDIWSGKSTLSSAEQEEMLLKAFSIYMDYLKIDQPPEVGAQWVPEDHTYIAYYSALNVGVPESYAAIIRDNAPKPDDIDGYINKYRHFYNGGYGGTADYWTAKYTTDAINSFNSGNYTGGYANIGLASHYINDVGNPYHTTLDPLYLTNHGKYEGFVRDNWTAWNLNGLVSSSSPITITDPAQSTRDLAAYSSTKLAELDTAVSNNDFAKIKTLTVFLISNTASYEKGLINYAKR